MRLPVAGIGVGAILFVLGCSGSTELPPPIDHGSSKELTAAFAYLSDIAPERGIVAPREQLKLTKQFADKAGNLHLRFNQQHMGIEVVGSGLVVHLNPDLSGRAITGQLAEIPLGTGIDPRTPMHDAQSLARMQPCADTVDSGELVFFYDPHRMTELAYRFHGASGQTRCEIFISALDNRILATIDKTPLVPGG